MIRQEFLASHRNDRLLQRAYVPDLEQLNAGVALIGIPTDFAASMRRLPASAPSDS